MRRWRTVGFIGVPTTDGRIIEGEVTARPAPLPLMRAPGDQRGHEGSVLAGRTAARVRGNRIEARLRWRDRKANLDLDLIESEWSDDPTYPRLLTIVQAQVVGLTVGAGPSAWKELR